MKNETHVPHSNTKSEVGKTYGSLTVVSWAGSNWRGVALWNCHCECGRDIVAKGQHLRRHHYISCGCYRKQRGCAKEAHDAIRLSEEEIKDRREKPRICKRCNRSLPPDRFERITLFVCRNCRDKVFRERRATRKKLSPEIILEQDRRWHRQAKYGLSDEQYQKMLVEQDHRCPMCNREFNEKLIPNVDHIERDGKIFVRGLPCGPCNRLIGHAYDNPTTLRNAAIYVETR